MGNRGGKENFSFSYLPMSDAFAYECQSWKKRVREAKQSFDISNA